MHVTMGSGSSSLVPEAVMAIVCVGVDLAKNVRPGPRIAFMAWG